MPQNQNHLVSDTTLIQVVVREEKASLLMLHCFGCVQIYFLQKDDSMKITRPEFQNQTMKNKILKIPSIYRIQRWLTTMRWHLVRLPRYVAYTECYNESICRIISGTLQLYRYYISTYSLNS